jgi:hypothetical protein
MGQQTIAGQFPSGSGPSGSPLGSGITVTNYTDDAALGGTIPWIITANQATLTYPSAAGTSHGLIANNFGFAIPATATIVGVLASIARTAPPAASVQTIYAELTGVGGSANRGGAQGVWGIPASESYPASGATNDLWGATITPAQVNSAAFGVEIQVTVATSLNNAATVPSTRIAVYYTLPEIAGVILADASANNFQSSQWTEGGAVFYALPAQPTLIGPWQIISYAIAFQGLIYQPSAALASYGLLGSIWSGLLFNQITPPNQGSSPWQNPMPQFPAGSALIAKLWDGDEDTPFPYATANVTMQPGRFLTFSNSLPVPVTMQPGENLTIGLWLTPSLAQNAQLLIANATFEIIYDDTPNLS